MNTEKETTTEKPATRKRTRRPSMFIVLHGGETIRNETDQTATFVSIEKALAYIEEKELTGDFDIACIHRRVNIKLETKSVISNRK